MKSTFAEIIYSGYFGNEDLTADRFISHTFGSQPPLRLYRTGDLAAYLPDGTLVFHGRADDQVKFRGFRIEPMEITNCVLQIAGIQEAFVIFDRSTDAEHARLICYFVGTCSVEALRAELKSRLPDYMIPTDWMQLDELPITPNGKVDRKALPSPVRLTASDFEAPAQVLKRTSRRSGRLYSRLIGLAAQTTSSIWADIRCLQRGSFIL